MRMQRVRGAVAATCGGTHEVGADDATSWSLGRVIVVVVVVAPSSSFRRG